MIRDLFKANPLLAIWLTLGVATSLLSVTGYFVFGDQFFALRLIEMVVECVFVLFGVIIAFDWVIRRLSY